jgi:hypothetical protein
MTNGSSQIFSSSSNFSRALAWVGLMLSWLFLFLGITMSSWDFIPYEAIPPEKRPAMGWERTLNDFLEQSSVLPIVSGGLVVLSILLFRQGWVNPRMKNQKEKESLIGMFALSNLICVVLLVVLIPIVAFLPLQLTPPPGYGYTIKFILKDVLLIGGLIAYQFRKSAS